MALDVEAVNSPKTPRQAASRRFAWQLILAGLTLALATILVFHTIFAGQVRSAHRIVLQSRQGTEVHILTLGAIIQRIIVPDKNGKLGDIVLGFDDIQPYTDGTSPYFGAVVGRVANRIKDGKFSLDGKNYNLSINDPPNSLHGGENGWSRQHWHLLRRGSIGNGGKYVKLGLQSSDGDEGYPGTVHATVMYTLTESSKLTIKFEATSDAPTPINMAQHCYFNLNGVEESSTVLDHVLQINSSYVTPVDQVRIPTGKFESVSKSPFDFSAASKIGSRISKVPGPLPVGYDINYVLWGRDQEEVLTHTRHCRAQPQPEVAVTISSPKSGRRLEILTDSPGLQFYSGNQLDGVHGKGEVPYIQYGGFALETQMFPNFVNEPKFPECIVRPGESAGRDAGLSGAVSSETSRVVEAREGSDMRVLRNLLQATTFVPRANCNVYAQGANVDCGTDHPYPGCCSGDSTCSVYTDGSTSECTGLEVACCYT